MMRSGLQQKETKSEMAAPPLPSRGSKKRVETLRHSYILGGSPTKQSKIRNSCLAPAFLGAIKRAEMLLHPCILRGRQQRVTKSEMATSPLPSRGPKGGLKSYVTPAFLGSNKKEKNDTWLPQPRLLGGPKMGGNAPLSLHSRGSPTKKSKIKNA